jgi:hypothetical protein
MGEIVDISKAHIRTDSANKMKFGKHGWKHSADMPKQGTTKKAKKRKK